jgi:hypothetical protein
MFVYGTKNCTGVLFELPAIVAYLDYTKVMMSTIHQLQDERQDNYATSHARRAKRSKAAQSQKA